MTEQTINTPASDAPDAAEVARLLATRPDMVAAGYFEAGSDYGRTYDDDDANEAYDLGRQLGRSYLYGINE